MAGNARRRRRHSWQSRQCGFCKLQIPQGLIEFESHPLRQPSPSARCAPGAGATCGFGVAKAARGYGWQAASVSGREGYPPEPASEASAWRRWTTFTITSKRPAVDNADAPSLRLLKAYPLDRWKRNLQRRLTRPDCLDASFADRVVNVAARKQDQHVPFSSHGFCGAEN